MVADASLDPRFASGPLVQARGVRSYAGMSITDHGRYALGSVCVMDFRPRLISDGDLATLRDLAIWAGSLLELRRTTREVRAGDATYRDVSRLSPHIEWAADPSGRMLSTGPYQASLAGYDRASLLSAGWQRLMHPNDWGEVRRLWAEAVGDGRTFVARHRLKTPAGEWRWFQTVAVPQRPNDSDRLCWYGTCEDVSERHASDALIAHLNRHDRLTDLPITDVLREIVAESCARGDEFALLSLDIDNFKAVNDSLGWRETNSALITIATRLAACVGDRGSLARSYGHQFHIVQRTADVHGSVERLAERIGASLREPIVIDDHAFSLSVSIGAALSPSGGQTVDRLFHNAELALHRAKAEGRGTFRLFTAASDERTRLRQSLTLDLGLALHRGELGLAFQPFVNTADGRVEGFEALLRWDHPTLGTVPPSEFVPLAEQAGLIVSIGAWVLERACHEAMRWPAGVRVAVNLSPLQLRDPDLPRLVAAALANSGLAASRLELEITESVLIVDDEIARATMRRFRELGVWLVMDDFGAGFSSLDVLQRFCFDKVKIDRSFVARLPASGEARALLRALLDMAGALQITAVVEGVETVAQLDFARSQGCATVQGYLFSAPVEAEAVIGVIGTIEAARAALHPRGRFGLRRFRRSGPVAPAA